MKVIVASLFALPMLFVVGCAAQPQEDPALVELPPRTIQEIEADKHSDWNSRNYGSSKYIETVTRLRLESRTSPDAKAELGYMLGMRERYWLGLQELRTVNMLGK